MFHVVSPNSTENATSAVSKLLKLVPPVNDNIAGNLILKSNLNGRWLGPRVKEAQLFVLRGKKNTEVKI